MGSKADSVTEQQQIEKKTLLNENLKKYKPEKSLLSRKSVSTEENKKKYCLKLTPQKECAVYQVDNYIIKEGNKCDKLVVVKLSESEESSCWAEIFVELKGRDIEHAIAQLRTTVQKPIFKHPTITIKRARIIGQSFPRNTGHSVMEKARNEFKKDYAVDLKGWSSGNTDTI